MNKEQRTYFCKRVTNICTAQCTELHRLEDAERGNLPSINAAMLARIKEGDEIKLAKQLLKEVKEFLEINPSWHEFDIAPCARSNRASDEWSLGWAVVREREKLLKDIQAKYEAKRAKLTNTANRLKDMAMFGGDAVKLDALLSKFAEGKLTDKDIANCKVFESIEG